MSQFPRPRMQEIGRSADPPPDVPEWDEMPAPLQDRITAVAMLVFVLGFALGLIVGIIAVLA